MLVVEDDPLIRNIVTRALEPHGYLVQEACDLESGRRAMDLDRPDALVLDIELGPANGFDLLREVREAGHRLPVLMLTGRASEADRVLGLELGADDYVVKPFFARELAARIGALLRRREARIENALVAGRLTVDLAAREVAVDGTPVVLTTRELDLLAALMHADRTVLSRERLLRDVWHSSAAWQSPATVTEHVRRLRAKLEAAGLDPAVIMTVRGAGYRFDSSRAG